MTQAESQYFALLRAALWNTPVECTDAIDWKSVMQIANHHSTNVLISDVAVRMSGSNKPNPKLVALMQADMRNNLMIQLHLKQVLLPAIELLHSHGIEPVLLKGFGLAMRYPNPSLRQFGDIDLYVGLVRFHEACNLLRSLPGGYNCGKEMDSGRHYNIEFGQYPMEVHRVSADETDPRLADAYAAIEQEGLADNLQYADFEGFNLALPSKEFQVFFTFFHAWHHFLTTGVGWRQISDVAVLLHAFGGQLDMSRLKRYLDTMEVMEPWQAFGWLMVEYLGLPAGEMPFTKPTCRRVAQRLYRHIMEEGNFKRKRRLKQHRPSNIVLRKMSAFLGIFVDFFHVASMFPKQAFHEMSTSLHNGIAKNL